MESNQLINLLTILLGIMIGVLCILCLVFLVLKLKSREHKEKKVVKQQEENAKIKAKTLTPQNYTKESIFKFMEFDGIEDNMILQKGGKRFLMVIECQGVNYDLMSGLEKNSVEQGFLQFLNTKKERIARNSVYILSNSFFMLCNIESVIYQGISFLHCHDPCLPLVPVPVPYTDYPACLPSSLYTYHSNALS